MQQTPELCKCISIYIYCMLYVNNILYIYIYVHRIDLGILLLEAGPGAVYESLGTAARELRRMAEVV